MIYAAFTFVIYQQPSARLRAPPPLPPSLSPSSFCLLWDGWQDGGAIYIFLTGTMTFNDFATLTGNTAFDVSVLNYGDTRA